MTFSRFPYSPKPLSNSISKLHQINKKYFFTLQGIFSALRMICIYSSLQLLPLGDAITLFFTIPLFTMIFAFIILRTPIKIWKVTFGVILMTGVILIVRPPFIFPAGSDVNVTSSDTNLTSMTPLWDFSADDTRGQSEVVLFSSEFWVDLMQNGKLNLHCLGKI